MSTEVSGMLGKPFVLTTFFDGDPSEGGGFMQKRRLLDLLGTLRSSNVEIIVVCSSRAGLGTVHACGLRGILWSRSRMRTFLSRVLCLNSCKRLLGAWTHRLPFSLDALLRRVKTDLVFFTSPDDRALELVAHNFAISVWDLCHLEHPEFAEVAHRGEFERREYFLGSCLPKAVAVIVDSEHGKKLVQGRYFVSSSRIHVTQFLIYGSYANFRPVPQTRQRIIDRYRLVPPYVFYPAQIWPHKNHKYILEALHVMQRDRDWVPQFVFCGADKGGLQNLLSYARTLGVERHVTYLGFVPDEYMPYLYSGALALVMPTYFGPTNVPPLEALALGVPVCYSDLESFRSQLGNRAMYLDLRRPSSLVDALEKIRAGTSGEGQPVRTAEESVVADEQHYVSVLKKIIDEYRSKTIGGPV